MTDSQKLDYLIEQFTGVKGEISGMKGEISGMKKEISEIKENISEMREDIHDLQGRMDRQENEIRYIKTFQENNLERNIKIIAEGHMNLNRKLNEALKITEDDEMLHLRVNVLECDMGRVKDKLAMA